MRFEMKNLTSFPMEKLCFDLKSEALEQMEPRDVYELGKVNRGFQGMLVRDPSIVFGEHVSRVIFDDEEVWIKKFSNAIKLNVARCPFFHFSFIKKIRGCDDLKFQIDDEFTEESSFWKPHQFNEKYTLLKNFKLVNQLYLEWDSYSESLEGFFSNFHASIKKQAKLDIYCRAFDDQVVKDRIENFLVAPQLKDCEKIWFDCRTEDSVRFCYNALLKSEIKNVGMGIDDWIEVMLEQIIINGIPSKNPEAAICLDSYNCEFTIDLSEYPGMRRIDGENRLRLLKQANDLVRNFGYSRSDGSDFFMEESPMFHRRFDSTKDCICVYRKECLDFFLAFYVPVD